MWSALTPGRKMRATAEISQSAPTLRLNAVSSAPRIAAAQVSMRGTPSQPARRGGRAPDAGDLARHGADAAAHGHRGHVQLPVLQPFGRAHVVGVGPGPRHRLRSGFPGQPARHDDRLPELVEDDGAGEGLVAAERDDDVGLVALGLAGEVEPQLMRPGRSDGGRRACSAAGATRPICLSSTAMPMPVRLLIRASTWRSGSGSSRASTRRPSSMPSAVTSGGLVSASAAVSSSARRAWRRSAHRPPAPGPPPRGDAGRASIVRRDRAALQVVVEVVAMERRHDLARNAARLSRSASRAAACRPASPASAKMVTRRRSAGHCHRATPSAESAAQDRDPEDRLGGEARSRCLRRCQMAVGTDGNSRTAPSATEPSIFFPPAPSPSRRRAGRCDGCRRPAHRRTCAGWRPCRANRARS